MGLKLDASVLDEIIGVLEQVPLFEGLSRKDLEKIAGLVRGRTVAAGELIFREGERGDKFYIVHSGSCEVLKEKSGAAPDRLAVKRPGDSFGEMALLTDAPRSATVRAVDATSLFVLARDQFDQLLGGDTLATRVMKSMAKSLWALNIRFGARNVSGALNSPLTEYSRAVQKSLLPREVPQARGFEVAAAMAQDETGRAQALWDAVTFDGGVLFSVMDAKGPGLPPAHLLSIARALLRELAGSGVGFDELLPRLNRALYDNQVTGADAVVEIGLMHVADDVTIAIAGDQPAFIVRSTRAVESIAQHGPGLGAMPDFTYGTTRAHIKPDEFAAIFSGSDQALLGGAAELINSRHAQPVDKTAALLRTALVRATQYRQGDDISFVIVRKI